MLWRLTVPGYFGTENVTGAASPTLKAPGSTAQVVTRRDILWPVLEDVALLHGETSFTSVGCCLGSGLCII